MRTVADENSTTGSQTPPEGAEGGSGPQVSPQAPS